MALTANDLKPIEKALLDMNKQLENYQKAILEATKATDAFVKKEEEAAKKATEVSLAVRALGGNFNKTNNRFEIGGKRVDEYGRRLNKVGDIVTSFNKRTSILGLSIKELQDQGKSFEIFSRQTLKEYRKQGGNILEFIAEGISGTREEITLLGMEGAKFRRILYGFFPPGAFRLINKAATVFQFFGSAVRRSTDSGKEHQENLKKLREERDKHAKGSAEYLEAEEAISKHMEGGEGRMGPLELLLKGFNKIPKFSMKGKTGLEGLRPDSFKSSRAMLDKEIQTDIERQTQKTMFSTFPIIKDANTVLQKFQKVGLGTEFEKSNRKATRTSLKDTRKMLLETNKITNKTAAQNLERTISSMKMSRDEIMNLRYSRSLRTERGTFGSKLPANLQAQLDTGLKDPSQLNTFNLLNDTLKKLRSGKVQADPTLLEQAKNIQKLLDSSSSINFMIGEIMPQLKLSFERGKRIGILTKLFLMKHAFKLAKLATLTFGLFTKNPVKLGKKLMKGAGIFFEKLLGGGLKALMAISRFTILMTGYVLYYGIIITGLIIALRKPLLKGFLAFKQGFATVMPVILFALDTIWGGFKKIYQGFKDGDLFTIIEGVIEIAFGLLLGLWSVALGLFAGLINFLSAFITKLFNQAKDYVVGFYENFALNYETLKKGVIILTLVAGIFFSWPAIVAGIVVMIGIVIFKKIRDVWNSIKDEVKEMLPFSKKKKKESKNVRVMDAFAKGGVSLGGLALVGEKGPEIVDLPKGSRVHSNNQSKQMMGNTFNITINAKDTSKAEMKRIADEVGRLIALRINKMTSFSILR